MLWINGKMTDLTKKDAIHKLVDAKGFLERYSNPHDKWTEAINIGIEAIEIVMDQEEQEGKGMTIDEHIGVIEDLKSTMSVCMTEPEKTEICTSLSEAIDTLRKYKKIEQIFQEPCIIPEGCYPMLKKIREVMKDGNDD